MRSYFAILIAIIVSLASCGAEDPEVGKTTSRDESVSPVRLHKAFDFTVTDIEGRLVRVPPAGKADIHRFLELAAGMLEMPPGYLTLVDKDHTLPHEWAPGHLVDLDDYGVVKTSRRSLLLDRPAADAFERLSRKADNDGITLIVSSAYRSYAYQEGLFATFAERDGTESAERYSARAGTSQHQLGTTVDLGDITNAFAESSAGEWMTSMASYYGWSLSYPSGMEAETGYMWESWHWRWIGADATAMQDEFFDGVQQRLLEFWHENEEIFRDALRK